MLLTPLDAARYIALDYNGGVIPSVLERLDIAGVQSVIFIANGAKVLLIRGSNEKRDWLYNLDFRREAYAVGDTWAWHCGFLAHARIAYAFAKNKGVQLVIGHSLGAAAMQIVASSLKVPGIGFASPRALYGQWIMPNNQVLNICRVDDLVTGLPFAGLGFNHCGEVRWIAPMGAHHNGEHGISHYIDLLEIRSNNRS